MDKILILGAKGMLGQQLLKAFGSGAVGWDREEIDFAKISNFKFQISNLQPAAVINCVAYNDVDGAESHGDIANVLNAQAVGELAKITKALTIPLVHFSTNYVFDGQAGEYKESDEPHPLSVYGQSKFEGELNVKKNTGQYYIIRTAVLFGQKGESTASKRSFVDLMLDLSQKTAKIKAVTDEVNSLTYAADLAQVVKDIVAQQKPFGLYHVTNSGSASWYDLAKEIFSITERKVELEPVSSSEFSRAAQRPKKAVLINTKLPPLRPWQEALKEFLRSN